MHITHAADTAPSQPTEIIGYWFAASDELPHGDGRKVVAALFDGEDRDG